MARPGYRVMQTVSFSVSPTPDLNLPFMLAAFRTRVLDILLDRPQALWYRACVHLHVARETAEAYRAGIEGGGLLFWIRTDDGRAAEAASVLRQHEARHLTS
jgi:hypothetical protein